MTFTGVISFFNKGSDIRRESKNKEQRAKISKEILKQIRRYQRRKQNRRTEEILQEFKELNRFDSILKDPIKSSRTAVDSQPTPEDFAIFLEDIFLSTSASSSRTICDLLCCVKQQILTSIPPFRLSELRGALRSMKNRKCADTDGVVIELFKYGSLCMHQALLDMYNRMLVTGQLEPTWQHTLFAMLPKQGDLTVPGSWRPIAILKITYKIFSKLIYQRLREQLEQQQACDQVGFRAKFAV